MKSAATINGPQIEAMDLTIQFTMSVSEWRKLMREQTHVWPSSDLGQHIANVLGHITKATEMRFSDPTE